ncbi:MAG: phenylacetate--CoA ligase family protein, partial [Blautia sp.]|nr:phenylacetate--CoA ligase family protein [Blautia sp.]
FGCKVNMDYANEENGVMAAQTDGGEYYVDSTAWHFEFLKFDSDEEAAEGELSRIVVTDLYNYAFPLIRYDTGDTAMARREAGQEEGTYRIFLKELYGRRLDLIYDVEGKVISPHYISTNMHGTDWIRQWQFVQEDQDHFLLRISGKEKAQGNLPSEEQASQIGSLLEKFREMTGGTVNVEYVDEIPVLASGKRKCILNKMSAR